MGEDYKQEKEEKEGEAQNETTAEKSNEESSQELAKEGAEFAEGAGNIGAKVATGDQLGAVIESVKLVKKNKIARTALVIALIQPILITIILLSIIMGIVKLIFEVIAEIGAFFGNIGTFFFEVFNDGSGRSEIIIGDEEFEGIKNTLKQNGIDQNKAGLSDLVLKTAILANYRTTQPYGIVVKIGITQAEKDKLDKYGYSFKTSDIPQDKQIPDEELKKGQVKNIYYLETEGAVYIKRPQTVDGDLKYVDMSIIEAFKKKEKGENSEWKTLSGGMHECFSIDQNGNLVIPHLENVDIYKGDAVESEKVNTKEKKETYYNNLHTTTVEENHVVSTVDYVPLISKYSIPLEFITTLTTYTQNEEFGLAIANLINEDFYIDLMLLDKEVVSKEKKDITYNEELSIKYQIPFIVAKFIDSSSEDPFWEKYKEGAITTIFSKTQSFADLGTYEYLPGKREIFQGTKKVSTLESISAQVVRVGGGFISQETSLDKDKNIIKNEQEKFKLDSSIEKNPTDKVKIEDKELIDIQIDISKYQSLKYLYDNNQEIKNFIDNEAVISLEELKEALNNQFKENEEIEKDINSIIQKALTTFYNKYVEGKEQKYRDENDVKLKKFIEDYKSADVEWKIPNNAIESRDDITSNTAFPVSINSKKTDITKQTTYYTKVNEWKVKKSGKEKDNTDKFIELLMDLDTKKAKEYRNYAGYKETPLTDLTSSPDMLFNVFASNPNIANMENLMRWIMQKMTGGDYGVESFNTVIYDLNKFNKVGGQSSLELFKEYLFTVEHGGLYSSYKNDPDMKYFDVGITGYGENHLYVGFGLDLETSGYHDELLAIYNRENGTRKTSLAKGDKLKVEDVMKIIDRMIQRKFDDVNSITSGLKLEEYQKHVLVSRLYNGCLLEENYGYGEKGGTFVEVYKRYWKESDNHLGEKDKVDYSHPLYDYHLDMWDSGNAGDRVLVGRRKEEWLLFQTGYYEILGKYYTESGATDFLSRVAEIKKYMEDNKYTYGLTNLASTFEGSKQNRLACCGSLVGWAAMDVGYNIDPDYLHAASGISRSPDFEKIKSVPAASFTSESEDCLPGDVLYFTSYGNEPKHVEVYAGDNMTYSAGSTDTIQRASPRNFWVGYDMVHVYRAKK